MLAALARGLIAAGAGWFVVATFGNSAGLFAAVSFALFAFGAIKAGTVAFGVWFAPARAAMLAAQPS